MTTWPNWIDLVIVTILFRTCYVGLGRGVLAEVLTLGGAVSVVALTVNWAGAAAQGIAPWVAIPYLAALAGFWGVFLALLLAARIAVRRLSDLVKWERVHWINQGIGLLLGGIRGLWWVGFLLVVLAGSGVSFLQESVNEESLFAPRLLTAAQSGLQRVADRFPGAAGRGPMAVPPLRPGSR